MRCPVCSESLSPSLDVTTPFVCFFCAQIMVRSMTPDTRRDLARQCDDVSRREFDRPISFLSERRQFHGVL
ncbi:MAG TPA: hypothetical protein VID19_07535 [Candidatus Eremiobacteraceae bacterium]